jgi:hypothetical protein
LGGIRYANVIRKDHYFFTARFEKEAGKNSKKREKEPIEFDRLAY